MSGTTQIVNEEDIFVIQSDINEHIQSQQNLYNKLKQSEFVLDIDKDNNVDSSKIVTPDNIMDRITNASEITGDMQKEEELQNIINNYFNYNYKNNTKLRAQYFEKIDKLNHELLEQSEELKKLKPELVGLETNTSTQFRSLKEVKRKYNEQKYYNNLYMISAFIQLLIIIIVILGYNKTIPKLTTILVCAILYILLTIYIAYMVLFTNIDRDVQVFDRFKFPVDKDAVSKCNTSSLSKMRKSKEKELDLKLVQLLDERQSKTQCLIEPKVVNTNASTS
jgi:hypothetical protein